MATYSYIWNQPIRPENDNDAFSICNISRRVPNVEVHESGRHLFVYINRPSLNRLLAYVMTEQALLAPPERKPRKMSSGEGEKIFVAGENTQESIAFTNNFDSLPDEIVLNIFQRLPQNQLGNVALVCRRFKQIVDDASLWEIIDASHRVINPDVWRGIMGRPVKILRLAESKLNSPEIWSEIRYYTCPDDLCRLIHLDLTRADISQPTLTEIFKKCKNLKRLSLSCISVSDDVIEALSSNKDLEILKLAKTRGITTKGIDIILTHCPKLKELNLAWTGLRRGSIDSLCENIPSSLEKLKISGTLFLWNEDVEKIVKKCPHIRELYLSYCLSLTKNVVPILQTLNELKILDIRGCVVPHTPLLTLKEIKEGVDLNVHNCGFDHCGEPNFKSLNKCKILAPPYSN